MYHPQQNEIFEYIRKRKNGRTFKIGVILGLIDNGVIRVGWSKCNIKKDVFSRDDGLTLAKQRAMGNNIPPTIPPLCTQSQVRKFGARCVRYFKNANHLILPFEKI